MIFKITFHVPDDEKKILVFFFLKSRFRAFFNFAPRRYILGGARIPPDPALRARINAHGLTASAGEAHAPRYARRGVSLRSPPRYALRATLDIALRADRPSA